MAATVVGAAAGGPNVPSAAPAKRPTRGKARCTRDRVVWGGPTFANTPTASEPQSPPCIFVQNAFFELPLPLGLAGLAADVEALERLGLPIRAAAPDRVGAPEKPFAYPARGDSAVRMPLGIVLEPRPLREELPDQPRGVFGVRGSAECQEVLGKHRGGIREYIVVRRHRLRDVPMLGEPRMKNDEGNRGHVGAGFPEAAQRAEPFYDSLADATVSLPRDGPGVHGVEFLPEMYANNRISGRSAREQLPTGRRDRIVVVQSGQPQGGDGLLGLVKLPEPRSIVADVLEPVPFRYVRRIGRIGRFDPARAVEPDSTVCGGGGGRVIRTFHIGVHLFEPEICRTRRCRRVRKDERGALDLRVAAVRIDQQMCVVGI